MKLSIGRALAGTALLASVAFAATDAQATIIKYSLDGGATFTTFASGAEGTTVGAIGASVLGSFTANTLTATSNSPGTPSLAKLLSSTLDLINNSGSTKTIIFEFGDTGFTGPVAPPTLLLNSHIGGTVVATGALANNALSFTSCVDPTNTLLGCGVGSTSAGPGTPAINTAASFADDKFANIASLSGPYSMREYLSITLGAGAELNFTTNTTLNPVPEPASLGLLGAGLVGLGLLRRKRNAKA